jgi:hypothetical protein
MGRPKEAEVMDRKADRLPPVAGDAFPYPQRLKLEFY